MVRFPHPIRRHAALAVGVASAVSLAAPAAAQNASTATASAGTLVAAPRLTVRPRAAATGTRTAQAGLTTLADVGFPDYYVSVPPQCVGTVRCPLVVLLTGGGGNGKMEIDFFRPIADSLGVIVLAPTAADPGEWDLVYGTVGNGGGELTDSGITVAQFPTRDLRKIDSAMKVVLRTHAIDPTKIAILGFSDGGSTSLLLGRSNPDVFSRVAALSALAPFAGAGAAVNPRPSKTQVFLSGGLGERMVYQTVKLAQVLRAEGYPVVTQLGLRPHIGRIAEEAYTWRWLVQSWTDPRVTTRVGGPYLNAAADTDVVLTLEAVRQITDFWARLLQEPGEVYDRGHMASHRQLLVPLRLGSEPVTVTLTDLPALAAKFPAVAAALKAAGLTAEQAMAYRTALARAGLARALDTPVGFGGATTPLGQQLPLAPIAPTSVLGQNLALWRAHPWEFEALEATGFYATP